MGSSRKVEFVGSQKRRRTKARLPTSTRTKNGEKGKSGEENIIEMNNGCICCTVRGDLIAGLKKMAAGPQVVRACGRLFVWEFFFFFLCVCVFGFFMFLCSPGVSEPFPFLEAPKLTDLRVRFFFFFFFLKGERGSTGVFLVLHVAFGHPNTPWFQVGNSPIWALLVLGRSQEALERNLG